MATTSQQIGDACRNIEQWLETFRADGDQVSNLQRSLEAIAWLREQYHSDKAMVEPHLDRIKALSKQVHEVLAAARESLTAKYLEAAGAISAWEGIREACRDALTELATVQNANRFESTQGWVDVKRIRSISLPKAGTQQREELAALITQANRWPDVAYPSAPRLLKAIDDGLFDPQLAGQLARLCPIQNTCRLIGHANGR